MHLGAMNVTSAAQSLRSVLSLAERLGLTEERGIHQNTTHVSNHGDVKSGCKTH